MSESPVWAANQGDLETAARILKKSYGIDAVVAPQTSSERESAPAGRPLRARWSSYGALFQGVYRRRTLLHTVMGFASSFAYNAVAFGLPVIIASFLAQNVLSTILASLVLNLCFAFVGGILAVKYVPKWGAWPMTVIGYTFQFLALLVLAVIGRPGNGAEVVISLGMLALFLFGQGMGPGSHTMTYASLSYPTSIRGMGVGLHQTAVRIASTISLFLFPVLAHALGTQVFWVIAVAPFIGLITLLTLRWEPSNYDVDAEDFTADASTAESASSRIKAA